jgi:hypothetical protein
VTQELKRAVRVVFHDPWSIWIYEDGTLAIQTDDKWEHVCQLPPAQGRKLVRALNEAYAFWNDPKWPVKEIII